MNTLLIMVRAPYSCPPLTTSTVLLLPHELLFTPRSSNAKLKISLDPFRYSSKLTEALKLTNFYSQIMAPFRFSKFRSPIPNSPHIATSEVSDLNSKSFTDAAVEW